MISNWGGSPYDLCRRTLTLSSPVNEVVFSDEVAAALHDLQLLDTDCERQCRPTTTGSFSPPPTTTWMSWSGLSGPKPTTSPAGAANSASMSHSTHSPTHRPTSMTLTHRPGYGDLTC